MSNLTEKIKEALGFEKRYSGRHWPNYSKYKPKEYLPVWDKSGGLHSPFGMNRAKRRALASRKNK